MSRQRIEAAERVRKFSWDDIDTVFLDMDGTLLDRYYDDYFKEQYVPKVYASQNKLDITLARKYLLQIYKSVVGSLLWTDLDYWSGRLGLDIVMMKKEIDHLLNIHPHVIDFANT